MLKKLKIKFITITVSIFSVIVLTVIGGLYYQNYKQIESRSDNMLERMKTKTSLFESSFFNPKQEGTESMWAFKITKDNQIIGSQYVIVSENFVDDLRQLATKPKGYITYEKTAFKYIVSDDNYIFVDMTYELERLRDTMSISIALAILALIFVGISSTLLANWALKPVEESWQKQKQFVSDASHELRTPLSVILANIVLLKDNKKDTIHNNITQLNYIEDESRRMKELIERLLFLAKNDQTQLPLKWEEHNLSDILFEMILPLEAIAFEKHKMIDLVIEPNILIYTDLTYIKQIIIILVDNAIKYSKENSTITISLNKHAILSVKNIGNVIPEDKLKHLFERFYRVETSRQRDVEGYGLGLAIADTIAKLHDTKINVTSSKEKGTIFSIDFSKKLVKGTTNDNNTICRCTKLDL